MAFMDPDTILTNAVLVLPDETITGTLAMKGATIVGIDSGRSSLAGARSGTVAAERRTWPVRSLSVSRRN